MREQLNTENKDSIECLRYVDGRKEVLIIHSYRHAFMSYLGYARVLTQITRTMEDYKCGRKNSFAKDSIKKLKEKKNEVKKNMKELKRVARNFPDFKEENFQINTK